MNTIVTSREAILQTSRELIRTQGWDAVNIRNVAKACDISVGSIYNYFQNKSSLVTATVESVWQDIFHEPENPAGFSRLQNVSSGPMTVCAEAMKLIPAFSQATP